MGRVGGLSRYVTPRLWHARVDYDISRLDDTGLKHPRLKYPRLKYPRLKYPGLNKPRLDNTGDTGRRWSLDKDPLLMWMWRRLQ